MPFAAGTQRRRYCVHNRDEPTSEEKKWWISAGHIAISTSCGRILAIRTMYWHESHAQVFALLRDIAEMSSVITCFGYDDACHFAPWVKSHLANSEDPTAQRIVRDFDFFIDKFHFRGHTDPNCRATYDPHTRPYVQALNTSNVEILWHWLNRYGHIVRHMHSARAELLPVSYTHLTLPTKRIV